MIIAVTGHRPNKLPDVAKVREGLRSAFVTLGASYLITGMALGVDTIAAEVAIDLSLPFTAAIPCDGQDAFWPTTDREHYRQLLMKAAGQTVVSPGPYAASKMQQRNEWMVDRCAVLVAVFDGSAGGTFNCVRYGLQRRRPIFRICPKTGAVERWGDWR